jgi:hypothetical protein
MKLTEITKVGRLARPESKLDIDNKVYIVYDENGNEFSRHPFKEVWNSSPARDAAQKDVNKLRADHGNRRAEQSAKDAEARPLSAAEQDYIETLAKWQRYYNTVFPKDKSKEFLDSETKQVYIDQMDAWMHKLERMGEVVRKSIINGTYKPPV